LVRFIFAGTTSHHFKFYANMAVQCILYDFKDSLLETARHDFAKMVASNDCVHTDLLWVICIAICASFSFEYYLKRFCDPLCFDLADFKKSLQREMYIFMGGYGPNFQKVRPRPLCYCYGVNQAPKVLMSTCHKKSKKVPCCNDDCFAGFHTCGTVSLAYSSIRDFVDKTRDCTLKK